MNLKRFTSRQAPHLGFGVGVTLLDFCHWYEGVFIVPWYRCTYPLIIGVFLAWYFRPRKKDA